MRVGRPREASVHSEPHLGVFQHNQCPVDPVVAACRRSGDTAGCSGGTIGGCCSWSVNNLTKLQVRDCDADRRSHT